MTFINDLPARAITAALRRNKARPPYPTTNTLVTTPWQPTWPRHCDNQGCLGPQPGELIMPASRPCSFACSFEHYCAIVQRAILRRRGRSRQRTASWAKLGNIPISLLRDFRASKAAAGFRFRDFTASPRDSMYDPHANASGSAARPRLRRVGHWTLCASILPLS